MAIHIPGLGPRNRMANGHQADKPQRTAEMKEFIKHILSILPERRRNTAIAENIGWNEYRAEIIRILEGEK